MDNTIYDGILKADRTLGILLDPEKMGDGEVSAFAKAISTKSTSLTKKFQLDNIILLVGGSTMEEVDFEKWVKNLRSSIDIPVVIFPGSHHQVTQEADALLFLNLISGRNPEYLIEQQVSAASKVAAMDLEVIPTAYLLLDGGKETAVSRVSKTLPIDQRETDLIINTALAGQFMGNQLIYLEAGSGAIIPVKESIVKAVCAQVTVPVIVGGGLRTKEAIEKRFNAGAKMIVVGTAIEENLEWI